MTVMTKAYDLLQCFYLWNNKTNARLQMSIQHVHNCIMDVYLGCSSDHLVFEGGASTPDLAPL